MGRQRQSQLSQEAVEQHRIRTAWKNRRTNPDFLRTNGYGEKKNGDYALSKSEVLMSLAQKFKRPIREIREIVSAPNDAPIDVWKAEEHRVYTAWREERDAKIVARETLTVIEHEIEPILERITSCGSAKS